MYKTLGQHEVEQIIKKSRFIALSQNATTEKEAKDFVESVRQKYYDARHIAYAYRLSDNEQIYQKSSDDGEPSGTAGKPILNLILNENLMNVCICVVRYFGGIKLGAGGLVRAYSKSVMEAIGEAEILEIEEDDFFELIFEYSDIKIADTEVRNNNLEVIAKDYADKVIYNVVSKDNRDIIKIFEKYSGKIKVNYKNKQFLEK